MEDAGAKRKERGRRGREVRLAGRHGVGSMEGRRCGHE
jgi:hypothetical protein